MKVGSRRKMFVVMILLFLMVSNVSVLLNNLQGSIPSINKTVTNSITKEGLGFISPNNIKSDSHDESNIKPLTKEVYLKLLKDTPRYPGRDLKKVSIYQNTLSIPSSVNNTLYLPPVGNQGQQGSCNGWASAYYTYTYMQYWYRNHPHPTQEEAMSPAFTYNLINDGTDSGSQPTDSGILFSTIGVVPWSSMPYNQNDYTTWPTEQQYLEAMHYIAGNWYSLNIGWGNNANFTELKNLLAAGYVVETAIKVYDDFYDITTNDNNIYAENETHNTYEGGHAQTIIGYDDSLGTPDGYGAFRVVNSWGSNWGDNGYYWLTYTAARGSELSYQYVWVFVPKENPASYNPKVISFLKIQHDKRGEIIGGLYDSSTGKITVPGGFALGTMVNNNIVWSKRFFDFYIGYYTSASDLENYQAHPFPNSSIALDLTDSVQELSKYANNWKEPFFVDLRDKVNDGDTGELHNFSIEINSTYLFENVYNTTLPIQIPENGNSLIARIDVPLVDYGKLTPLNNTTIHQKTVTVDLGSLINVSAATLDWNGTNYTMIKENNFYYIYNITNLNSGEYWYKIYITYQNGNQTSLPKRFIKIVLLPDLTIDSVSVSPSPVNEGSSVNITASIRNIGDAPANNVSVGFYYDSISNTTYIGSVTAGTLNIENSTTVEISWNTTGHIGKHTIIAYADPNNIIEEKDENNNIANTTITINGYGVNLTVDSSSKTVTPGGTTEYNITVTNIGTVSDTFDLSISQPTNGWSASLSSSKVTLNISESAHVILYVNAPSDANYGDIENITITATSENDTTKSDSVCTTTIVETLEITSLKIYSHLDVIINYTTSLNAKTYIEYGIGPSHMNHQTPEDNYSLYHEIAIENLTPGLVYFFKVFMSDGSINTWSKVYNFTLTGSNDFETTDNPSELYNWKVYAMNSSTNEPTNSIWQWGVPTAGPSSAHSGNDVIGTVLNGDYGVDDHIDALITPWINLENASWVTLSFYAWYDLENGYDGVLIAYQNDSSNAWYVLDRNNNASQYNEQISTSYGSAIGGYYAFTGSTNGWVQKVFNTTTINDAKLNRYILGHKVRFIFYFASDNSVHNYYGFYLDDILVKAGIPTYHIYGYIRDSSGNPIENATVWINDTTLGLCYKTVTATNGRYDIYTHNGINGDSIEVTATNGVEYGTNTGTLGSTGTNEVEINITLQAVPELSMFIIIPIIFILYILFIRRKD